MDVYERTQEVDAPADEVFAFLKEPANLPRYLPPITGAESHPGSDQVSLEGDDPDGNHFRGQGYFRIHDDERKLEWGSNLERQYSGRMHVDPAGSGGSLVTVHLEFGPRSEPHREMQERSSPDREPGDEALAATLETIRRQIEEGSGQVMPPPPGG
jgi:uncharacterized protein YndB with AHSA1/START domain